MNTFKKIIIFFCFFQIQFLYAQSIDQEINAEDYRWLYEQIFSPQSRQDFPNESFKSFKVHLLDSYKVFIQPADIAFKNLKAIGQIQGQITYASVFKKTYRYHVSVSAQNELILKVRIHLKNPTAKDLIIFKGKLQQAENLWNYNKLKTNFNYSFKFEIVDQAINSDFSVTILDHTRGPYDTFWSRDWPPNVIAHEVGHMLGLGDEYETVTGKFDCLRASLMCSAWSGKHLGHEYYFVLRRLFENIDVFEL